VERGLNADYDGDTVSLHVPLTQKAINDAVDKILPSKNLFTDEKNHASPDLLILPDQDATLGIYKASVPSNNKKVRRFKNITELKESINRGEVNYNDIVIVA